MNRLNPFAKKRAELIAKTEATRHTARVAAAKAKKTKAQRQAKSKRNATYTDLQNKLKASYQAAQDLLDAEDKAGNYVPGETSEDDE